MEWDTVETIGWITRAVLAAGCVGTICYLAICEKKIDPTVSTVLGYLIGGFVSKKSSDTTSSATEQEAPPTPFKASR